MGSKEDVPPDIAAIFVKYRERKVKAREATKLARWIIKMKKIPDFNFKSLTIDGFEYTTTDYKRLERFVQRLEAKLEPGADTVLKEHEAADFAKFIEDLWNEAKKIATDTLMRWHNRAIEYGYFDEEKGAVRMKDFLEDACNFYIEKRDMIETVEEKVRDLQATCAMFAELSKPNVLRIVALRSYVEFANQCTLLAARGIPVPESVIMEVKNTVNEVILSTYQPMKGVPQT